MSIEYKYEVVAVDQDARCMEVVYTSPGRQTMHIGARLPYVGETLDAVIKMYAPVAYWMEQAAQVQSVAVGASGKVGDAPITLESAKANKLAEIAAWRYARETAGVKVNGATISLDRQSQAQLSGAYTAIKNGLLTSVDWKAADGVWVTLTAAQMESLMQTAAKHIQACFDAEKALAQKVAAAQTIEDVDAVVVA